MSRADDLFRAFNLIPSIAVWRFELDGPVPTAAPPDTQVDAIFRHAFLAACNDAMARMYGHGGAADVIGARLLQLLPDVPANREYLRRFIASNYQLANEESHEVDRHGAAKVFVNNFVGVVENGTLVSAWGTQVDVTAQRQQELRLRESDERLRLALAAAGMGTWQVDLRTGTATHDACLNRILGGDERESSGSTVQAQFLDAVHPEDRERTRHAIDRAIADGADFSEDLRILRPDGTIRWIRDRGRVIHDGDGVPVLFTGAVIDITEQRRAEEYERLIGLATAALASSPEYEKTLADVAGVVVSRFAAACAVYFNTEHGIELIAQGGDEALVAGVHGMFETAASGAAVVDDGAILLPLRAGGRVFGAIGFVAHPQGFDGDDRSFAVQLTDYVALAVDHARLFRDLQQANRLKDEFLATLSHELRTPLNAVLGWTRMLRKRTVPPERTDSVLDTIERNAAAQMQLVEELLDLSAMAAGGLRLDVTRVDLRDVVSGAIETIRPAADAKSVTVTLRMDGEASDVAADPGRLRQVLWNLLSNAVKFTPAGGAIHVNVSRGPTDAEISVRDTGVGIAREFLPHVFEAFRQGDSSSTRVVGGLGLGLAIVRHIVEAHGGTVSARSEGVGRGSVFVIRLPAARPSAAVEETLGELTGLRGRRVLAVDDDESTQELVATMLLMYGVSVRTAGRTGQALEILSAWRPDVLLADLAMPGEDGYALVRRVRALPPPLGGIPAVALTAFTDPHSVQNAFAAGFDAHLGKPLEPHVLANALSKVLRRPHR